VRGNLTVTESLLNIRGTELPSPAELAELSASFEHAPATRIIAWAADFHGDGLVLTSSFEDCVMLDLATRVVPDIDVVFLDTQYHFAETLWYVEKVRERYDLNLRVVRPNIDADDLWQSDVDKCCQLRKVEPLARALEGKTAWMTGLRRADSPSRADAPILSWNERFGLIKVNPLANWTDLDVHGYVRDHDLPRHPLNERGYPSIGCWPCTMPVADGDDPRSGRWAGTGKVECGLHG